MKNITFSADDAVIRKARERARRQKTTLNQAFRDWLERYATRGEAADRYEVIMEQLSHVRSGGPFTRDEMNER